MANNNYEEFEQSVVSKEDLVDLERLEDKIHSFKENPDDQKLRDEIRQDFLDWDNCIKDDFKPDDQPAKDRLSQIADKVSSDVNAAFNYNDGEKIKSLLTATYERSKVDLLYGRTFLIYMGDEVISNASDFHQSEEDNNQLVQFILDKNIEVGKEIMSDDYVELLNLEKEYIGILKKS